MSALDRNEWVNRKVAASYGIASIHVNRQTQSGIWDMLYRQADEALYYSKNHGRNQLNHYDDIQRATYR